MNNIAENKITKTGVIIKFYEKLEYWCMLGAAFAIVAMMLVTSYDVFMRYVFNSPTTWAMEISTYLITVSVFLALAYVLRQEGHIRVEIVFQRVKPRVQTMLLLITSFLSLIVFLTMAWYGTELVIKSIMEWELSNNAIVEIPLFPVRLFIPVGTLLLIVRLLLKIFDYMAQIRGHNS